MSNVKTITPNPPADFTPTMGNYTQLSPFRYWCQKVLPLVYDDSLSYYELLCKVVDYLNKAMEDVETLHGDVTNLHAAYKKLQSYVNNYFSTLDIQQEINKKLDEMVTTGSLTSIINDYFSSINTELSKINSRIDEFTKLEDGSTTADAELTDGRITWSGYTEKNLGNAIRRQTKNNSDSILELSQNTLMKRMQTTIITGKILSETGEIVTANENNYITNYIDISMFKYIKIKCTSYNSNAYYCLYDKDKTLLYHSNGISGSGYGKYTEIIPIFNGIKYIVLSSVSKYVDYPCECLGYTFNNIINIFDYFEKEHEKVFEDISVKFNPGFVIDINNGNLISTDLANYYVSDPINLSNDLNEIYATANNKFGNATIAFYTSNNHYITGLSDMLNNQKVIIPSFASYCRIAWNGADYDKGSVKKILSYTLKKDEKWGGVNWCCIGDSLTERNSRTDKHYYDYIKEKTNIEITINAISGTGYARGGSNNFKSRCETIGDYDVYTIFGSFNDLGSGYELGSVDDYGDTTICGFINNTISNIYKNNPLAVIGIVSPTPWNSAKPGMSSSDNYVNALKNICYNRGIPFLDLYHNSGLRPWEESYRELVYSKDDGNGVHPNEIGHKLIAPRFKSFLEQLITFN